MHSTLPEELRQQKNETIVREVLKDKYISLEIFNFTLKENLEKECLAISCSINFNNSKIKSLKLNNEGSNLINALFVGIVEHLSKKFDSLKKISFEDFSMKASFKKNARRKKINSPVEIELIVNVDKKKAYFRHKSNSMNAAAIAVTQKTIEYFINAELAVIHLYKDIENAASRNRTDLTQEWTMQLAELIKIISYEDVIKKIKNP